MKMIVAENISKTYVEKELLKRVSFSIQEKERVGLIGVNGTGKSTFLKIIAGLEAADEGEVVSSSGYSISFLTQNPELNEENTVLEQIFAEENELNRTIKEYENCMQALQNNPENESLQTSFTVLQQEMDAKQAWDRSSNAKAMLHKLGIENVTLKVGQLSGGQKKRVALAQVLMQESDLLILDEPTNHLDFETIQWLEEYLLRYNGSVLLVTHDRYFLDKVTTKIFELSSGNLYTYEGNYASYLEAKAIRLEEMAKAEAKQKSLYRQELEWMRKGAKARTTKQKARIKRFENLEDNMPSSSDEKMEIVSGSARLGRKVVELKDVSVIFGEKPILKHIDLLLKQKDRIGIVGPNGAGKSTLLNLIADKKDPTSGEVDRGTTVKIGYYTQEQQDMNENQRMIEYIKEEAEVLHSADGSFLSAAQLLERFLFPPHSHGTPIYKLSGGERKRLYLLRILMSQPNLLLLDEPTNDLDTETLTILEAYLDEFPGVVVTVSHDRYFLDKVVDELLILDGRGSVERIFGEYTDYLLRVQQQKEIDRKVAQVISEANVDKKQKGKALRLTYQEQKDWDTIEERISSLEESLEQIETEISNAGSDYGKISEWMEKQKNATSQLEQLMERWEELSEKVETIEAEKANQ
ncbi:ABC-F family ATP-binding cassette domain-containing protein [Bacillus sp. FJAT-45066]|uniref:ABC-F family ATP-binding cassette domain-containing protein n=1 Tax=Bacillus sp. FJAT-45066 TaxID=2011010 RepID=UPI000BB6D356|nr:ABC-F family ATP-binding cassette domain-containing protein [Bacillus sp. FJAT-45066]